MTAGNQRIMLLICACNTISAFLPQGRLQLVMSAQFAKQEAVLKTRVAELEQKAAAAGVA